MPIIENYIDRVPNSSEYGIYPDFFVSEKKKRSDDYIKMIMDYWYTQALAGYRYNYDTFSFNYSFVKGQLRPQDFYENRETFSLIDDLVDENNPLPNYVQQYSIMSQPLNTMVGEQSKRPDNTRVKAFDDDSKSEELQFKTDLLNQYIMQKVQQTIYQKMIQQGADMEDEQTQLQFQQITEEQLSEYLTTYTSQAEKWGNRMLESLKMEFNLKELSEEGFRDLLISGRERYHIYEDNSKLGFNVECVNPKNVWVAKTPNKKYIRDAYAAGLIDLMELSEILERFNLTKEEVDHLQEINKKNYLIPTKESNLFNGRTGINSIDYVTYDPLKLEERLRFESTLMVDPLEPNLGIVDAVGVLGQRFVVVQAYWLSKKKIGKLTFINEDGEEQSMFVDENYKNKSHPYQIDLEWGYVNQWWKGVKIGPDIYYSEPLEFLDYCPIIGVDFENRNSSVRSLIDMIKPYQMIFNVCMNQLWELLEKEQGVMVEFNWRKIPVNKDSSYEDALQEWLDQAKQLGFVFNDDSPENMKAPTSNTNTTKVIDASRTAEMQSRLNIANQVKMEAYALVGINPQRLGSVAATETLGGTQTALAQSYSATENYFVQHEYVKDQLYQAILDAAQYIESTKPVSTISYISNEGEHAWVQINGSELKLRDLRVYVTSRAEDQRIFQELRALAQPMLQNGTDVYTISQMYVTNSIRTLQEYLKKSKEKIEAMQQQQLQIQQQQIQSQQQNVQMQIQAQQQKEAEDRAYDAYQKELDRINKKEVATINASSRNPEALSDANNNGLADALEVTRTNNEIAQASQNYQLELQRIQGEQNKQNLEYVKLQQQQQNEEENRKLKERELDIKEKQIDTQKEIAIRNKNKFDK